MSYAQYLRELLAPLRIYDLKTGAGAAELDAAGELLDRLCQEFLTQERESCTATAMDHGLSRYEELLPYTPAYITPEDRRRALNALLRIDGCSFTPEDLQNTVAGCGIQAVVQETGTPFTVEVHFPRNRGIPDGFPQIQKRIEQILPCHLEVLYVFIYFLWHELEANLRTWAQLEAEAPTWKALEVYLP